MTIKNSINLDKLLVFEKDIYDSHVGTPEDAKTILTYPMWIDNSNTLPLLNIGYNRENSEAIAANLYSVGYHIY